MLYPCTINVDFHIQAKSIKEAERILQKLVSNDTINIDVDSLEYPEVVLDEMEINNPIVINP